jgi:hypothetical protein
LKDFIGVAEIRLVFFDLASEFNEGGESAVAYLVNNRLDRVAAKVSAPGNSGPSEIPLEGARKNRSRLIDRT